RLLARAENHRKNKRAESALRDLRRARQVAPDDAAAHLALGLALLEGNSPAEALRPLKEAVRIDPQPASPYLALALALEASGDVAGARATYAQFIRLAEAAGDATERVERAKARLAALPE